MYRKYWFPRALGMLLITFLAIAPQASAETLSDPYKTFVERDALITSGRVEVYGNFIVEVDGDEVASYEVLFKGSAVSQSTGNDYQGTLLADTFIGEDGVSHKMDIVSKGGDYYFKFKNADNKSVRNKWIKVPEKDIDEFAEAVQAEHIITVATALNSTPAEAAASKKEDELIDKYDLWLIDEGPTSDRIGKAKVDTYVLRMNRDTVVAYFEELDAALNAEQEESTTLSFDGFREGLKNRGYMDRYADNAVFSISFDKATGFPVAVVSVEEIRDTGNDTKTDLQVAVVTDKINKKVTVKAPKKWISAEKAFELLGIE
jgi:hypothetical protein